MSFRKDIIKIFESNNYSIIEIQATDHNILIWEGWVYVTNNETQQDYEISFERCCELLSMGASFKEISKELEFTIIEE